MHQNYLSLLVAVRIIAGIQTFSVLLSLLRDSSLIPLLALDEWGQSFLNLIVNHH